MLKTRALLLICRMRKCPRNPADVLATYSLGSCIAVCLYDPSSHIGGMIHYQLPDSKIDAQRAAEKPLMFADTGMKILIEQDAQNGCKSKNGCRSRFPAEPP